MSATYRQTSKAPQDLMQKDPEAAAAGGRLLRFFAFGADRDGTAVPSASLDGFEDARVWDFTDRGEGLRNTTSLLGKRGTGQGRLHWSANFDEVQDFEHDIRNAFNGTGFMSDADFATGTRNKTLGDRKAGVSPELGPGPNASPTAAPERYTTSVRYARPRASAWAPRSRASTRRLCAGSGRPRPICTTDRQPVCTR